MFSLDDPLERPGELIRLELEQREQEGYDVSELRTRFHPGDHLSEGDLAAFFERAEGLVRRASWPYVEPSEWDQIVTELPANRVQLPALRLSDEELRDRILGAWLGRCAGCLLGKPVEGWVRKEDIERYLRAAGSYPLDGYIPWHETAPGAERLRDKQRQLRGHIRGMVRDDDIDYMILALNLLEQRGPQFSSEEVAAQWLHLLPYRQVYTAERAAYRNLVNRIWPPRSATWRNPFREWIGAQIRGDVFGYVAPGRPDLACAMAYRDARVSHVGNGIYGELFAAALVSAAFVVSSPREAVERALEWVPARSRLAEAIREVMGWTGETRDWERLYQRIDERWGRYHWIHTINNAAVVTMALLVGEGDYERSITIAVMCGYDTDCNGATVGSVLGAMLGRRELPHPWVEPLEDRLESSVRGYERSRISDLAYRTFLQVGEVMRVSQP